MITHSKTIQMQCQRCGHKWIPRKLVVRVCPKCISPYFDVPRQSTGEQASKGGAQ